MSSFYHSRPHFQVSINQYRQIEEHTPLLPPQLEEKPNVQAEEKLNASSPTLDENRPTLVSTTKPSNSGSVGHHDNFLWMILRALEDRVLQSFGLCRSDIRED